MPTELETLVVRLKGDAKQYEAFLKKAQTDIKAATKIMETTAAQAGKSLGKGLEKAIPSIDKINAKIKSIGKGLKSAGLQMSLFVTGPLTLIGGIGVAAFAKFNSAMTKSLSIMKGITPEIRTQMEGVAKAISAESITAPAKLAEAYFFLASAGLDAEQSMAQLATVNQFAEAGAFDMATATDLLTDAQTALGLKTSELAKVSDALVLANVQANASVQQFAESLTSDAAVAARGFGIELGETVAILGAYASQGKKGAEAGNLFGRATRLLAQAQRDQGAVFEKFGIRVIEETSGKYRSFIDIIADMETAFGGLTKPQRAAALETLGFATLAQKAILPLIGMSKQMGVWKKEQEDAAETTKKVAERQLKSFSSQMKIVKNNISLAANEIGTVLAPMLISLGNLLRSVADSFRNLNDSTKKWIVFVGLAAASIGGLVVVAGTLLTLVTTLKLLTAATIAWNVATTGVAFALASIQAPVLIGQFVAMGVVIKIITAATWALNASLVAVKFAFAAIVANPVIAAAVIAITIATIAWRSAMGKVNAALERSGRLTKELNEVNKKSAQRQRDALNLESNTREEQLKSLKRLQASQKFALSILLNRTKRAVAAGEDLNSVWNRVTKRFQLKGAIQNVKNLTERFLSQKEIIGETADEIERVENAIKSELKEEKAERARVAKEAKRAIEERIALLGKVGFEAENTRLKLGGLTGAELKDVVALQKQFTAADKLQRGIDLAKKFERDRLLLGLTGREADLFAAKLDGLSDSIIAVARAEDTLFTAREKQIKLADQVKSITESFQRQLILFGKTGREAELFAAKLDGLSEAQLVGARALDQSLSRLEKQKKLMEEGAAVTKEFQTPLQKFNEQQTELQELLNANAITTETFTAAMNKARESLEKPIKVNFTISGIQALEAGTAEAAARIEAFRAHARRSVQITQARRPVQIAQAAAAPPAPERRFGPRLSTESEIKSARKELFGITKDQPEMIKLEEKILAVLESIDENTKERIEALVLQEANL